MQRNNQFHYLPSRYLFPEINRRKEAFLAKNPHAQLISLGIGDTTEPIPDHIVHGLQQGAASLGTKEGYTGYGPEQGIFPLRKAISEKLYQGAIHPDDIFISDGSKCDIGRLQLLFGPKSRIALQDPAYPAYLDTSLLTALPVSDERANPSRVTLLPCTPENAFFPDLELCHNVDVLFICSPNNPTGSVFDRKQLTRLVHSARERKQIIVFDAAYRFYIQDRDIPSSIYEIPGAEEVAIELGSFSKMAGFTGVRLGWSVIPSSLKYDDGSLIKPDWSRIITTFFNGASIIAQRGGLYALSDQGLREIKELCSFYMTNCQIICQSLEKTSYQIFGGKHIPYLWVHFGKKSSWDIFEEILEKAHLVTTPGSGFGPSGEGFIRISAYAGRQHAIEAAERIKEYLT